MAAEEQTSLIENDALETKPESQEPVPTLDLTPLNKTEALLEIAAFWPFMLRYGIFAGFTAAQTYIIANKELDYVGAYSAYSSMISIAIGMLYGSIWSVVTLVSAAKEDEEKAEKEKDLEKINEARQAIRLIWRQGILFAGMLSVPALVFGYTGAPLFALFNQPQVVVANSHGYLRNCAPGFMVDIFYRLTARMVSGLGVRKSILVADALDKTVETLLIYGFLNGRLGLPELGLPGVGLAYSISKTLTVIGHLLYMAISPACLNFDYKKYRLFSCDGPFFDKTTFKKLINAGVPDGLSSILSGLSGMLVVMFCGQSGTAPLVGVQVATVYDEFAGFHMSAVGNAACNRIGAYYNTLTDEESKHTLEEKKVALANVHLYTRLLVGLCVAISIITCGIAFFANKPLTTLLIDKNDINHQSHLMAAMQFLRIQGVFQLIHGFSQSMSCVLDAFLDNRFLLFTTVIFDLILNPGAAAVTHYGLKKNAEWVYAASGLGSLLSIAAFFIRYQQKMRDYAKNAEAYDPIRETTVSINMPAETAAEACNPIREATVSTNMPAQENKKSCLFKLMFWKETEKDSPETKPLLDDASTRSFVSSTQSLQTIGL